MKINKSFLIKKILPVVAGAGLGYAYYFFIGCTSGSCPISSNPYISTLYGALIGLVMSIPSRKKAETNSVNN
jgi:hypothetical protein